jgi:hypothetical protein
VLGHNSVSARHQLSQMPVHTRHSCRTRTRMAGARKLAEDGVVQVVHVPPPHVYPGDDGHRRKDGEHLQREPARFKPNRETQTRTSLVHARTHASHRHGPDGHGVVLERVPEVGHHVFSDKPVEGLDGIERAVEGDEDGQHDPVEQVQPRDPGPVGLQVEARRSRTGGGHRRQRRRHRAAGQPTTERTGTRSESVCAQVSCQEAMDGAREGIANAKCE